MRWNCDLRSKEVRMLSPADYDSHDVSSPASGSGLAGIRRRVDAHDGTFELASPAGGSTTVTVSLPCGL
ncbi:signal transduction histidine kinase [Plantactinospora soyae]|uniref:Signal transduction histidine kinase n=1 Tax=Plantactinospora soyae TaxID=1544732 RepID=A0A927QY92_9ACTN|nr:signal transduction histidine kinase [Plantactinospora soyae]